MCTLSYTAANNVIMCHYLLFHTCSLGDNFFGDDGLEALSEGIKNCKELKVLR